MKEAVEKWEIDLIVPVHEEIFFLAECDEKVILDKLLAPPWHVLIRMHNKWEFARMMGRLDLGVPEAHLCTSKKDVRNLDQSRERAVKPVFGRASSNIYHLKPGKPIPEDIDVSQHNHYIAQEWIKASDTVATACCDGASCERTACIRFLTPLTATLQSISNSTTMQA